MDHPKAVLFDAYGTLFDVYSVGLLAEQLFPGQGQALSVLWRDKQIEYTRLVTTSSDGAHYQPFWDLTRASLRYACKRLGLELTTEREQQLMNQYRHLSAFPENREVLQALRTAMPSISGSPLLRMPVVTRRFFSASSTSRFSGKADRCRYWFISCCSRSAVRSRPSRLHA